MDPEGAQLSIITDAAGQNITLSYDASGNLASIDWPDGKSKTFLYENNNGALTGITDELNQRFATFGYDAQWRAISTEHAGGEFLESTGGLAITSLSNSVRVDTNNLLGLHN